MAKAEPDHGPVLVWEVSICRHCQSVIRRVANTGEDKWVHLMLDTEECRA